MEIEPSETIEGWVPAFTSSNGNIFSSLFIDKKFYELEISMALYEIQDGRYNLYTFGGIYLSHNVGFAACSGVTVLPLDPEPSGPGPGVILRPCFTNHHANSLGRGRQRAASLLSKRYNIRLEKKSPLTAEGALFTGPTAARCLPVSTLKATPHKDRPTCLACRLGRLGTVPTGDPRPLHRICLHFFRHSCFAAIAHQLFLARIARPQMV